MFTMDSIWQYFAGSESDVYLSLKAREDSPMLTHVKALAKENAGIPEGGQPSIRFWTTTCALTNVSARLSGSLDQTAV
jgi:hypothetical protein